MRPVPFIWNGEAMEPKRGFNGLCDKQFVVGEAYVLAQVEERSMKSHRHYFAALREVWKNLPEDIARRFPSPDHLRKWLLIKCGYAHEKRIVCATAEEAQSLVAFFSDFDAFAIVSVDGRVAVVYTAQSQSLADMDKATFAASKEDVLNEAAGLISVDRKTLEHEATLAPSHSDERTRSPVS